nr:polysialyltransferase family glycosyltransferase [Photobacterium leiognathi]
MYTDKFYFNSISLLNEMREKNPKYKNSFEFMPNLKKLKLIRKHNNYILKKVVYFSQPIYQDDEIELIVNIKKICDKLGLEFKIKPHPRQAQALFKDTNVQVLSNSLTFSSIIHDTDLVLTRTSTIGLDCWLNNIPVIFIRHNKHLKNIIADYLPLNYVGDISSVYELNDLLGNNSNYLFKQFYNISESFLEYNEDFDFLTSLENEK